MIDWRMLFMKTISLDMKMRADAVKHFDKIHPVMCHTVPLPCFNSITCAADDWELAEYSDMFGNSAGSNDYAATLIRSCCGDKEIINSEVHAAGGLTLIAHQRPELNAMKRHIFIPLSKGSKGFVFWQYRPEVLGLESPAWGSVDLRGKNTDWHDILIDINEFLQREKEIILNAEKVKRKAAVYVCYKNEVYCWNLLGELDNYNDSLLGAFDLFNNLNYDIDFIRENNLQDLSQYDVVYFPHIHYFNHELASKVQTYIKNGGIAIFEPFAGMVDEITGLHEDVVPGCGFDQILNIEATKLVSAYMVHNGYKNEVYKVNGEDVIVKIGDKELTTFKYLLHYIPTSDNVEILGTFSNGDPAILKSNIGKGFAVTFGSLFAASYYRNHDKQAALYIKELLKASVEEDWRQTAPVGVRIDEVRKNDRAVLIINNITKTLQTISIPQNIEIIERLCNKDRDIAKFEINAESIEVLSVRYSD